MTKALFVGGPAHGRIIELGGDGPELVDIPEPVDPADMLTPTGPADTTGPARARYERSPFESKPVVWASTKQAFMIYMHKPTILAPTLLSGPFGITGLAFDAALRVLWHNGMLDAEDVPSRR